MQRRSQAGNATPSNPKHSVASPSVRRGKKRGSEHQPAYVIIAVLGLLFLLWRLFPARVLQVEQEAEYLAQKAIQAEQQVVDNLRHQQLPPRTSEEATAAMLAQSSTWVDGEKKLKQKLKVLSEMQQKEGKLLGVPVLTRYLGEDVPAWVTPDMDEAAWKTTVEQKYADMRKEEEEWQQRMQALMDQRDLSR